VNNAHTKITFNWKIKYYTRNINSINTTKITLAKKVWKQ